MRIVVVKIVLVVGLVVILFGLARNWMVQSSESTRVFQAGNVPKNLDGFYGGKVNFSTNWQGKEFVASGSSGINIFLEDGTSQKRFPFKTYQGRGLQDPNQVLKIDYNLPANPWWVRLILDEAVEISPGRLLGKIHVRSPLGSVVIGHFELQR